MKNKTFKQLAYDVLIKYQGLFFLLIALDQLSKYLAVDLLANHKTVDVIGSWFQLELTYNTGVAFSMLKSMPGWVLALISVIATIGLEYIILFKVKEDKLLKIGLIVLAAGAFGNAIDRWLMTFKVIPGVIDFFDVEGFAVFNIADAYVTVSCIGMILYCLFGQDDAEPSYKDLKKAEKELEEESASKNLKTPTTEKEKKESGQVNE